MGRSSLCSESDPKREVVIIATSLPAQVCRRCSRTLPDARPEERAEESALRETCRARSRGEEPLLFTCDELQECLRRYFLEGFRAGRLLPTPGGPTGSGGATAHRLPHTFPQLGRRPRHTGSGCDHSRSQRLAASDSARGCQGTGSARTAAERPQRVAPTTPSRSA